MQLSIQTADEEGQENGTDGATRDPAEIAIAFDTFIVGRK
jgi:hypothetical protein